MKNKQRKKLIDLLIEAYELTYKLEGISYLDSKKDDKLERLLEIYKQEKK